MKYNRQALLNNLQTLIETPSVVGYYAQIHPVLEKMVQEYGFEVEYDHRHTAYVRIPGRSHERTRAYSAHLDTIGLVVCGIDQDGTLLVRNLGGINCHSLEGENMIIHTRENGNYTGTLICRSHSVHVFEDARSLEREPGNMRIVIDEDVRTPQETAALGIQPGDLVSTEPRFVYTPSGYIKSRHIDDKVHVAILLECLHILQEENLQPAYDTILIFNIYEEIGIGSRFVPEEVDEFYALDIACVGGPQCGSEKSVTVCAADRVAPYDWELTGRLARLLRENNIQGQLDVFRSYSSDSTAAVQSQCDLAHALFGTGTLSSHGYERTHITGVEQTLKLTLASMLDAD